MLSAAEGTPLLGPILFGKRLLFLVIFVLITSLLGYQALQMRTEVSSLRMIPTYHAYIKNCIAPMSNRGNL